MLFGGSGARLVATAGAGLDAADLVFELEFARPDSFAILLSGPTTAPAPSGTNPCAPLASGVAQSNLLDGLRCVASGGLGPVLRHGVRPIDSLGFVGVNGVGPEGRWSHGFDFGAGETRHFQALYRTGAGELCGTRQNTSQRVTVTFTP